MLAAESEILEQLRVRLKIDECAVLLLGATLAVVGQLTLLERHLMKLAVPVAACHKLAAQRVDRLQTYAVEAHTGREDRRVILGTCVKATHCIEQSAQRDATAVVAHHGTEVILHLYLYALTETFVKLIYTVVDSLLQ